LIDVEQDINGIQMDQNEVNVRLKRCMNRRLETDTLSKTRIIEAVKNLDLETTRKIRGCKITPARSYCRELSRFSHSVADNRVVGISLRILRLHAFPACNNALRYNYGRETL
jgi:hypothetical protein